MTDDQIKHMTQRFLMWKLPDNFNPDNGISFKPTFNDSPEAMKALGLSEPMRCNPVGTNLFDATQAEAMVRHMADGLPGNAETPAETIKLVRSATILLRAKGHGKHADAIEAMLSRQPSPVHV